VIGSLAALDTPVLVAHRGVPALAPENSSPSLALARDLGAPVVEIDARLAADGLFVVLHDDSPERMTGRAGSAAALPARSLIADALLADPNERLLLLDEALALLAGRTFVDIELKPAPHAGADTVADALVSALVRAGSPQELLVTSEDPALIAAVRLRCPVVPTGLVYRSLDERDAVGVARHAGASLIVANRSRCEERLIGDAKAAGLDVWAYTVDEPRQARELLSLGCRGIVTNDYPRLESLRRSEVEPEVPGDTILVLDLGSSSIKTVLVDPARGVLARAAEPTPLARPGPGRVEHDPEAVLAVVHELVERLAGKQTKAPVAAAIASQRSTGLWCTAGPLAPLTPAVSWRDRRGERVVERLAAAREGLEAAARLPLAAAWTAVSGAALAEEAALDNESLLVPLGSWIASRLTRTPPSVDPTLANRMFLARPEGTAWSPSLLEAFRLDPGRLPSLAPTVGDRGQLDWPGGGRVPLRVLVGDQQAAYIGAAGPTGQRLVVNVGTAGFVMRVARASEAVPDGGRIAPLWTSAARPDPFVYLLEIPVLADDETEAGPDEAARQTAREVALGEPRPVSFASRVGRAASLLVRPQDRTSVVSGGVLASPHLLKLLSELLPVPPLRAVERELTSLGAARLAAASAGMAWRVPPAGGLSPVGPPGV
jgi:glycerophosphoryl diester phosphodiesterase